MKFQFSILVTTAILFASGCAKGGTTAAAPNPMDSITPGEVTAIAKEDRKSVV